MSGLRRCAGVLVAVLLLAMSQPGVAHPMPGTQIAISISDDGARFDIAVPVPELRLALPRDWSRDADLLAQPRRATVLQYFNAHFSVRSPEGRPQAQQITALSRWQASDPDVGAYEELRLRIFVPAAADFDAHAFSLHYDAIIHQVPNHFALVRIARDFRNGELDAARATEVGVIRYDFARDTVPALEVSRTTGSMWRGLRAAMALGFIHVAGGLDHLLFLATLLMVAPLRAMQRRWSLFQGWRYATRRFLAISLAFTAGHSVALLLGAYEIVPVPRAAIEVLIAASILVTALHAIRPLFAGREWLVAAGFGIVHGLAFAESLTGLAFSPLARALTVSGFNLGVEGAQLVAMAAAVPLLLLSRWRGFDALRVASMLAVAGVAVLWMMERVRALFG